jgi:competence protein ComEA
VGTRQELGIFLLVLSLALPGVVGLVRDAGGAGEGAGDAPGTVGLRSPDCRGALMIEGDVERAGLWCPGERLLGMRGLRASAGLPEACELALEPGQPGRIRMRVGEGGRCDFERAPLPGARAILAGVGVELNTATAADLEAIPGIGPRLAERILSHRAAHGPFATPDDLLEVRGIGPMTLWRIKRFLR